MKLHVLMLSIIFNQSFCFDFQSNKKDLMQKLCLNGVFKTGDFTFKSGQKSSNYIDLRNIISNPDILLQISECLWHLIENEPFDVVCGVPYAALPMATTISITHKTPMIMKRKETKDHGTKQMIEGIYKKGDRCLIIEDVITTGGSILETIGCLEQEGLVISVIVVCVDREQSGVSLLESKGYRVCVLYTLSDFLKFVALNEQQ